MTDHQFSLFDTPALMRELSPIYMLRFNNRIYQAKDQRCLERFAEFWGFNAPVEYAPVYFNVSGVCLRRIIGVAHDEETGAFK